MRPTRALRFSVDRLPDGTLNNTEKADGEYIVVSDELGGIACLLIPNEHFPDPKDAPSGIYPLLDTLRAAGVLVEKDEG
jgi:hypothetical protein